MGESRKNSKKLTNELLRILQTRPSPTAGDPRYANEMASFRETL